MNTVALTNGGEIYVSGSNAYGQLCKDSDHSANMKRNKRDFYNQGDKKHNDLTESINLIKFPGGSTVRVQFIACGGEHIFAITRSNELYGWGRNEEGQLGLGNISEMVNQPQLIKDLVHKNIT